MMLWSSMDGKVPDEGACVEIGIAYALGKECIGLKTDARGAFGGADNPMVLGALKFRVARSLWDVREMLGEEWDWCPSSQQTPGVARYKCEITLL